MFARMKQRVLKLLSVLGVSAALLRRNNLLALVAASVMLAVGSLAHAGPLGVGEGDFFTLNFDENGNGSVSVNGGAFVPLAGVLAPDPSQFGNPLVLTYFLPELVGAGDVSVLEPTGGLSDALRFTNANGGLTGIADRMIYYSDNTDGGTDLADTGFPANLNAGASASVDEIGPEGNNGFQFVAGGPNIYNGRSDVPEPGTLFLLGIGLIGFLARPVTRRWGR